jgi:copper(I)-binding protein
MKSVQIIISVLIILLFGCTSEKNERQMEHSKETLSVENTGKLIIEDAWVRVGAKGRNTAMFMNIMNGTELTDTLISAESDAAVLVEVHETYKRENDMMGMREVENIIIPPLTQVSLKPRGLHVMLINLNEDIQIGDTVEATLQFTKAGSISVKGVAKEMKRRRKNN